MTKERDKHLDDLYDTSKLKVPYDYGVATCLCGGLLNTLLICVVCHIQYSKDDVIFYREGKPL